MKAPTRITLQFLIALLLAFSLAACKTTPKDDAGSGPAPVDDQGTSTDPVTYTLDPHDYANPANFDNSDSPLSKNVIYFDFDQSTIRPEYRPIVTAHATYVAAHPSASVTLEGHADERGSREYNLGLGERRGNSVNGVMSAQGARGGQVDVISYGEERPTCRESSESCWSQNRRVEIVYTAR